MENSNEINKDNKNNHLVRFLISVICLLVIITGYLLVLYFKDDKTTLENNIEENTSKELVVYKNRYGDLCIYNYCSKQQNGEVEAFRIKAKSEKAKLIDSDLTNSFILYDDNGIKIYDVKNKQVEEIKLESNYKEYQMQLNEDRNKVIGIFYEKDDLTFGYYNVSLKKKLYDEKYDINSFPEQINDEYLSLSSNNMVYIASSKEEKIILSDKISDEGFVGYYRLYGKNDLYFIVLCGYNYTSETFKIFKIYSTDKKIIYDNEKGTYNYSYYDDFMYVEDKGVVKKYNPNGDLLLKSKNYSHFVQFIDNYAVYVKDNVLFLENIDNSDESVKIDNVKDEYYIWAVYYTREELDSLNEKNKKEGLYVIIEYNKKNSDGYYGMKYCYTKDKKLVKYPIEEETGRCL